MRTRIIARTLLIVFSMGAGGLRAQTVHPNSSVAFPILSVGLGARAVGMGDSFTAIADDLSAIHYNSAGLAQITDPQLSLMHNSYLDGGFYETLGFVLPCHDAGTLGLGINYLNYGSIENRDSTGTLLGSYTPFDISARGAFGFRMDNNTYLGISSEWMRQEIAGVVHTGISWDIGFLTKPFDRFSVGLNFQNLGVETGGYNLPASLSIGAAYRLGLTKQDRDVLIFDGDGNLSFQGVSRLNGGVEYTFMKNYFLRGGYSYALTSDPVGNGLSFGAGAQLGHFQLDYSFSFMGDLGNVQRLSLTLLFQTGANGVAAKDKTALFVPSPLPVLDGLPGMTNSPNGAVSMGTAPIGAAPLGTVPGVNRPVMLKFQVTADDDLSAQQLFDKAEEQLNLGMKKEALDLYLKVLDKDPNNEKVWVRLGKLYFDKSLESYRKVLELNPKNEKLRNWLNHFSQ
ncbi:MAG TPA: PorV/PorQ family protein [bacterium]